MFTLPLTHLVNSNNFRLGIVKPMAGAMIIGLLIMMHFIWENICTGAE